MDTHMMLVSKGPDLSWWGSDKWWRNWVLLVLGSPSPRRTAPLLSCRLSSVRGTTASRSVTYAGTAKLIWSHQSHPCEVQLSRSSELKMIIFIAASLFLWLNEAKWPTFLFPHFPINKPAKHSKFIQIYRATVWIERAIVFPCFTGFIVTTGELKSTHQYQT